MKKSVLLIGVIAIIFLFLGGVGGYFATTWSSEKAYQDELAESVRMPGYQYINPLLECETKTYGSNQKYIPFEKDLIEKINTIKSQYPNIEVSVYFRNMRNGPWFGINEEADFSPASLMKLPVLFMYMKWAEIDPYLFDQVFIPTEPSLTPQVYEISNPIQIGTGYTVAELLYHLIVYSDNVASNTLIANVPVELQDRVFTDLNIPLPKDMSYTLSVKEYASFFRILYNASYLTRNLSEKSLEVLSQSTFTGGLTGLLPTDIKVAHKFGERELIDLGTGGNINQLHDCGIVYYEDYPYLLCVMTRGKTEMSTLSTIIQTISRTIYDEVSTKFPRKNQ